MRVRKIPVLVVLFLLAIGMVAAVANTSAKTNKAVTPSVSTDDDTADQGHGDAPGTIDGDEVGDDDNGTAGDDDEAGDDAAETADDNGTAGDDEAGDDDQGDDNDDQGDDNDADSGPGSDD